MQSVSQEWKDNQTLPFVSEGFVEIEVNVGDPESQADAQSSDNGSETWADTPSVVEEIDKAPVKYATLEANLWILDGTASVLPDNAPYGANGYVGTWICGSDGIFDPIPTVTISFSKVFGNLIPGLTITWGTAYEEYPDIFRVTAYNGTAVVAQKLVSDNASTTSVVELDMVNYDKITVEILQWCLPYRRARIEDILVGIARTYNKQDIVSYSHEMTVDPLSAELPKAEITFEISNVTGDYNPDNPQGLTKYLMERQKLSVRYGYKLNGVVEWIKAGEFYMSEWVTPQNGITATFTARDVLEFMSDVYAGPVSGTLLDVATAALEQAALPLLPDGSVRWELDESLGDIPLPAGAELKEDTTIAEVLQLVANAGCCVLYQDRAGILHMEKLADGVTDYRIDQNNSYENAEIELTKQLKGVNVNQGQATLTVGETGETQPVDNELLSDAQALIVADWIAAYLQNRKLLSGEYRPDPRLDPLDRVTTGNKYAESTVLITEIKYTFNGAFRGNYEGRSGV